MVWEAIILFDIKHVSTYEPTVTYISTRISALGNTPALIHFLLNLVWHVNQAKSVEHPINVRHTSDVPQSLGSAHYLSDFTDIVIRQQHRAPSKALAALSAVNPEFFCVFVASAFSYFIREWQAGIGFKTHFLIDQNCLPQMLLCRRCSQLLRCPVSPLPLCTHADLLC